MQLVRRPITLVLAGGLVLRLLLAALPTFRADADLFRAWAETLAQVGPEDFYHSALFHAYAPGYMYFLWLLGGLNSIFDFSTAQWDYALKLPSIAADVGSAYLLYRFLPDRVGRWRIAAPALYLLFPATLIDGAVWGQNDSVLAFFLFLAVYFVAQDRLVAAGLAFTAGFIVKPQAIAALPFLLFWVVREHPPRWREIQGLPLPMPPKPLVRMIGTSFLATLVMIFPFYPSLLLWRPFFDLRDQVTAATGAFPLNSFFAFNFWELLGKDVADRCDSSTCIYTTTSNITLVAHGVEPLGLPTRFWGLFLFALAITAVLFALRRARGPAALALGTSLSIFSFYFFVTRMHERYLFTCFLPFLAACVLLKSRVLWAVFTVLGAVHFLNLYLVYTHSEGNPLRFRLLYDWLRSENLWGTGLETGQLLSAVMLACLLALIPTAYRLAAKPPDPA